MALKDKLYELRINRNMSQEELSEALGISRQAISIWETGKALPESDKLILLSEYFGVSIDFLLKEDPDNIDDSISPKDVKSRPAGANVKKTVSVIMLSLGILSAVYWVVAVIVYPSFYDDLAYSSVITLGGNGIYLIISALLTTVGTILMIKNKAGE